MAQRNNNKRKVSGGRFGNDKRRRPATVACYDCHEQVADLKAHRKVCTSSSGPSKNSKKPPQTNKSAATGTQHERAGTRGVDVRMDIWTELLESVPDNVPHCAHGPMLLFERYFERGDGSRMFWACAAHRDRKAKSNDPKSVGRNVRQNNKDNETTNVVSVDAYKGNIVCRAFCYDDSKRISTTENVHEPWQEYGNEGIPGLENCTTHTEDEPQENSVVGRLRGGAAGQLEKATGFCRSCQTFVTETTKSEHTGDTHVCLDKSNWHYPTQLLAPAAADKSNAQYFFSDTTIKAVLHILSDHKCRRVLCVGAPSIHEAILDAAEKSHSAPYDLSSCGHIPTATTYLLDIDDRFSWFYSQKQFCRYNMGNHSFWATGKTEAHAFMTGDCDAVVIDPPFGIPLEAFAWSVRRIWKDSGHSGVDEGHDSKASAGKQSKPPPTLIFFPYFQERQLLAVLPPGFTMSDYSVNYTNHPVYNDTMTHTDSSTTTQTDTSAKIRPSAVRIFTNVDLSQFVLPKSEGYTLCKPCQRYTSQLNPHCDVCGTCPSKDGRTYVHCNACGTCVKPGRRHCDTCIVKWVSEFAKSKRCEVRGHLCTNAAAAVKPTGLISFDEESMPRVGETSEVSGNTESALGMCHICGSSAHRRQVCPERRTTSERATLHLRAPHPRATLDQEGGKSTVTTATTTTTTAVKTATATAKAIPCTHGGGDTDITQVPRQPCSSAAFATTNTWRVSKTEQAKVLATHAP